MVHCCVPYCKSERNKNSQKPRISFHEFPAQSVLREKWISNISRLSNDGKTLWALKDRSAICSLHFLPDCFKTHTSAKRLKNDSVPTVFSNYSSSTSDETKYNHQDFNTTDIGLEKKSTQGLENNVLLGQNLPILSANNIEEISKERRHQAFLSEKNNCNQTFLDPPIPLLKVELNAADRNNLNSTQSNCGSGELPSSLEQNLVENESIDLAVKVNKSGVTDFPTSKGDIYKKELDFEVESEENIPNIYDSFKTIVSPTEDNSMETCISATTLVTQTSNTNPTDVLISKVTDTSSVPKDVSNRLNICSSDTIIGEKIKNTRDAYTSTLISGDVEIELRMELEKCYKIIDYYRKNEIELKKELENCNKMLYGYQKNEKWKT